MILPCLPVPVLATLLPLTNPPPPPSWLAASCLVPLIAGQGDRQVEREQGLGPITYPQPVGQGDHLGCDGFGVLLSDGIQDDVSQEAVTFLCVKHLFPGQRETQESHFCGGESGCGLQLGPEGQPAVRAQRETVSPKDPGWGLGIPRRTCRPGSRSSPWGRGLAVGSVRLGMLFCVV